MEVTVNKRVVDKAVKAAGELEQEARRAAIMAGYYSLREFELCAYQALVEAVNEAPPAPRKVAEAAPAPKAKKGK